MIRRKFLTAEWRNLGLLNFLVSPDLLKPYLPPGLELDFFQNNTFISVVGFQFLQTRVLGRALPFHRDFEEVNLRFYVRRKTAEGWRRGVVFIKEIVPRRAIATVARTCYGEPYVSLPMRHTINRRPTSLEVEYGWRRNGVWETLAVTGNGEPQPMAEGSIEEFITEHYWGYTACGASCREYQVEHPRWNVWPSTGSNLTADITTLYGSAFVETLTAPPVSAFIAEGSPITVRSHSVL